MVNTTPKTSHKAPNSLADYWWEENGLQVTLYRSQVKSGSAGKGWATCNHLLEKYAEVD